jgi:tight adherence protein B
MAFATAAMLVFGAFHLFRARKMAVQERIEAYTATQLTTGLVGQADEDEMGLSAVGRILRRTFGRNYFDKIEESLVRADLPLRPVEYILARLLCAGGLFILGELRIGTLFAGLSMALVGFMLPFLYVKFRQSRRTNKFNEQLANVLMLMTNSLRAGYSFVKALEVAASEMTPPISKELAKIFREVNLGYTMDEALQRAAKRVGSEDFDVVVSAYLVQKEVGGSLADIMEKVAETIRERFKLQGEIRVMTSQGKLSGLVVGFLPVAVGLLLWLVAPEFLAQLVDKAVSIPVPIPFQPQPTPVPLGFFLLGFAFILQCIGVLIIWRIVNIKV